MQTSIWSQLFSASFLFIIIRVGTPLMYASLSSYIASLAGIPNIAIEGIMNFGALFGVYFSAITGSAWLGLLGAINCHHIIMSRIAVDDYFTHDLPPH